MNMRRSGLTLIAAVVLMLVASASATAAPGPHCR
jgi:hypothetical protein